jgi:hypothetical protein
MRRDPHGQVIPLILPGGTHRPPLLRSRGSADTRGCRSPMSMIAMFVVMILNPSDCDVDSAPASFPYDASSPEGETYFLGSFEGNELLHADPVRHI